MGLKVTFTVTVEVSLDSCPQDQQEWQKEFQISPVGLNEKLNVNVELDCQCSCEKPENKVNVMYLYSCTGCLRDK